MGKSLKEMVEDSNFDKDVDAIAKTIWDYNKEKLAEYVENSIINELSGYVRSKLSQVVRTELDKIVRPMVAKQIEDMKQTIQDKATAAIKRLENDLSNQVASVIINQSMSYDFKYKIEELVRKQLTEAFIKEGTENAEKEEEDENIEE